MRRIAGFALTLALNVLWGSNPARAGGPISLVHPGTIGIAQQAVHPNGKLVITGDNTGTIRVWDIKTGEMLSSWKTGAYRITSLTLSPDGRTIVSYGPGESRKSSELRTKHGEKPYLTTIDLSDLKGGRVAFSQQCKIELPLVSYSPDGTKFLVTADDAVTIYLVDSFINPIRNSEIDTNEAPAASSYPDRTETYTVEIKLDARPEEASRNPLVYACIVNGVTVKKGITPWTIQTGFLASDTVEVFVAMGPDQPFWHLKRIEGKKEDGLVRYVFVLNKQPGK